MGDPKYGYAFTAVLISRVAPQAPVTIGWQITIKPPI